MDERFTTVRTRIAEPRLQAPPEWVLFDWILYLGAGLLLGGWLGFALFEPHDEGFFFGPLPRQILEPLADLVGDLPTSGVATGAGTGVLVAMLTYLLWTRMVGPSLIKSALKGLCLGVALAVILTGLLLIGIIYFIDQPLIAAPHLHWCIPLGALLGFLAGMLGFV